MAGLNTVVELDENSLKLITGKLQNGKFFVKDYNLVPSNPDFFSSSQARIFNDQVKRLEMLLSKTKIKDKRVHIVIPDGFTYSAFLVFPKLKEKELYSAIKFQADQFIPLKLDEASLDIDILEESKDKQKLLVLIVAAEKNLIERITELFEIVGLIPEIIEPQLSSIGKLFSYTNVNFENSLLINFNFLSTSVYFFEKKRRLIFQSHTFKTGYDLMQKEIALSSNIPLEKASFLLTSVGIEGEKGKILERILEPILEDFYSEIKQTVNIAIAKHSLELEKIFLFNMADKLKGIDKWLTQKLEIHVELLNPQNFINSEKPMPIELARSFFSCLGSLA